jgi:hypothetical protein
MNNQKVILARPQDHKITRSLARPQDQNDFVVFLGVGCYDAIETIMGVIEKLSNHC